MQHGWNHHWQFVHIYLVSSSNNDLYKSSYWLSTHHSLWPTDEKNAMILANACRHPQKIIPTTVPRARPFSTVNCRAVLENPSQRPSPSLQPVPSNIRVPQTDASLQFPESTQLYLGGRPLLGGRKVEEDATQQCVDLHESWQRGEKGPTVNKRWQGMFGPWKSFLCR